jgi:hypothetical protein
MAHYIYLVKLKAWLLCMIDTRDSNNRIRIGYDLSVFPTVPHKVYGNLLYEHREWSGRGHVLAKWVLNRLLIIDSLPPVTTE